MTELRIAVLVKQVPDPSLVTVSEDGVLQREGVPAMMDPFGRMALMQALRLRQERPARITAVSMGPPHAEDVLRKCMEYGVDDAVLISDRGLAASDTWATARTLSAFIKKEGFDLVFCGVQATDGDTAQVPAEVSVMCDSQIYSYVYEADFREGSDVLEVTQAYEHCSVRSEVEMPAVISFLRDPGDMKPLPSVKDFMRAEKADIRRMDLRDLDLSVMDVGSRGSKTKVISVRTNERPKKETVFVDGSDTAAAARAIIDEAEGLM